MSNAALGFFSPRDGQPKMKAVVSMRLSGYDQLVYRDDA